MKAKNRSSLWMFMIGLGSQTQFHLIGSLGISEFPIFLLAPVIFIRDLPKLKQCGFLTWIMLSLCVCVGCVVSSLANGTPANFFIKGFATPYSIFAIGVVFFHFLYDDLMSFKWFLLGSVLSGVICVFVFQPETFITSAEGIAQGSEATERVMSYPLFWARQVSSFLELPIQGWYLKMSSVYSWSVPVIAGLFAILFSDSSGRAAFITAISGAFLIFLGGRSRDAITKLGRHFFAVCFFGFIGIIMFKIAYSFAASSSALGERAQKKYEKQTAAGRSSLHILMAGRKEFFISLIAALDKPILGYGPKGEDTKGYTEQFLREYGSQEDFEAYMRESLQIARRYGYVYKAIPTHSHIGSFWVYYGIAGLVYWVYVLWLIWRYFRCYAPAIPQYFGFLALSFTGMIWSIFFNPYGFRFGGVLPIVCALFAKAVYQNKMSLTPQMIDQIENFEHNGRKDLRVWG